MPKVKAHRSRIESDTEKKQQSKMSQQIEIILTHIMIPSHFYAFLVTCKVIHTKVHEGFSKFVIKKLKVFHGLFAIQFLKSLMCTRMQSQFLLMVFPFFILQISFYLLFFVENRTENYPELIFICKKNLKQVLYEKHSFDLIFTANYTLNNFSLKFYRKTN